MRRLQGFAVWFLAGAMAVVWGCSEFVEKSPEEAVDSYAQARVKMAAGDYAGAAGLLKRYLAAKPTSEYRSDALVLLGDCETKLKAYPRAQASYRQALVAPRTKTVEARAKAGLGHVMMAQELYSEATTHYEDALAVGAEDINRPLILANLGRAYIRSGRWLMGRDRLARLAYDYPGTPEAADAYDIARQPSDTFSVQVGAFATREGADDMLAMLRERNILGARVVRTRHAETPFAVRVGNFVGYAAAVAECQRLKGVAADASVVP